MRFLSLLLLSSACSVTQSSSSTQEGESTEENSSHRQRATEAEPIDLERGYFFSHDPASATARDPLTIDEFNVSITTAPGTIRTRIDVVVRNPSKAQKQARMRVPMPSNAAVTEAVLFVGTKPMRGAFLGAKRAEQVYKSYTQRRRDPLLAVWSGPNWVDLHVFPIEGEKTRRFQLEWVEPRVSDSVMHRLPLFAHAGQVVGKPGNVLVNGRPLRATKGEITLQKSSSAIVSVRPPGSPLGYVLAPGERPSESALVLVAETSAKMTLKMRAKQRRDIELVLAKLPASTRVTLLSADWLTKTIAEDKSPEQVRATLADLDKIISAGSLDIRNTFAEASALAKRVGAHGMVFFGQGQSGFGAAGFKASTQALRDETVSLFVIAPKDPSPPMRSMVWKTGGRVLSTEDPQFVQQLRSHGEPPKVPGVEGWTVLNSAHHQPLWMGHFLGDNPEGSTVGAVADLAAIWARSQVFASDANQFLSGGHAVLAPNRSILVLENNAEYRRWGIPVPSAIGESKERPVTQITRSAAAGAFASGLDDRDIYGGLLGNEVGEISGGWGFGISGVGPGGGGGKGWGTIGSGNYGTIGHGGGSGYGYGSGSRGNRARRAKPPQVRIGNASVTGSLDKDITRRYVRRKLPRIRHCFEKELLVWPTLSGTVVTRFVIAPTGRVQGAMAKGLGNENVESCVAAAVRSIQFPKPKGGGSVNVRYPFTFTSAGIAAPAPTPLTQALASFDKLKKGERAQVLSKKLGVAFKSEAMLAWWIMKEKVQSTQAPIEGVVLAARLLHDAGDDWNSRRVFSQIGWAASQEWLERLRTMGFEADADRLSALQL